MCVPYIHIRVQNYSSDSRDRAGDHNSPDEDSATLRSALLEIHFISLQMMMEKFWLRHPPNLFLRWGDAIMIDGVAHKILACG